MIFIAHRGNIEGPNLAWENKPEYIVNALSEGWDVEVDIWYTDGQFWLGHNSALYEFADYKNLLYDKRVWFHAKDIKTLYQLQQYDVEHYFFHDKDDVVLTSDLCLWTYPGKFLTYNSICVLPENTGTTYTIVDLKQCKGVCSDYIRKYKEKIND